MSSDIQLKSSNRCHIINLLKEHKQLLTQKHIISPQIQSRSNIHDIDNNRLLFRKKVIEIDSVLDTLCSHEWYDDYIEDKINNMRPITYCLFCERTINYT